MENHKKLLRNSMVPSFKLLIKQLFFMSLVLSSIVLIVAGDPIDGMTFILILITIGFLVIGLFFLVWLRHFLKFKKAIKNIAKIKFEPDSTVFKVDLLMSLRGNFYRDAKTKTGKTVKCSCFANIFEEKRCVLIKISSSYYSIVI